MAYERPFSRCAPGADGYRLDHQAAADVRIVNHQECLLDLHGRKAIALCGFAESSRKYIPTDDRRWVLCGLNQLYRHLPRWDVWFDVHEYWRDGNLEGTDHPEWLAHCGIPVVMARVEPDVPTSVRFPLERIQPDYLTSTAAHMMAWAVDHIDRAVRVEAQRWDKAAGLLEAEAVMRDLYAQWSIGIFGIDLVADEEYAHQRPCMEFWIGRAAARGIAIAIPPECALLKQPYRYGTRQERDASLLTVAELKARGAQLDADVQAALAQVERLAGRREEQLHWLSILEVRLRGGTPTAPTVGR